MEDFVVGILPDDNPISEIMKSGYNYGFDTGYRAGFESAQPKWISVDERLPEKGQKVLVCGVKKGMQVGAFRGIPAPSRSRLWWWKKNTLLEVTHWMPLPSTEGIERCGLCMDL